MVNTASQTSRAARHCQKCGTQFDARNCPACAKKRAAAYYAENRDYVLTSRVARHAASSVEDRKKIRAKAQARVDADPNKVAAQKAAHYAANQVKYAARNAQWAAANPDKVKGYRAKYHAENRTAILERGAVWRESNREKCTSAVRAWTKANAWKVNAKGAQYRAQKLLATPIWASKAKIEEFYYTANMLGMHTGNPYHVDHIVPLQSDVVCGLHAEANLEVLTAKHNLNKGNRHWPDMPDIGVGAWARW